VRIAVWKPHREPPCTARGRWHPSRSEADSAQVDVVIPDGESWARSTQGSRCLLCDEPPSRASPQEARPRYGAATILSARPVREKFAAGRGGIDPSNWSADSRTEYPPRGAADAS